MGDAAGPSDAPSLAVSVVTFAPDAAVLDETLDSLGTSVRDAVSAHWLRQATLTVIDNGPDEAASAVAIDAVERVSSLFPELTASVLSGHGNVGYGAGHNLALRSAATDYYLVLNPDVTLAVDALRNAVAFMEANPGIGLLAPRASDTAGTPQYLCKRYPSPLVLAIRGFAPDFVRRMFGRRLARYEMRDVVDAGRVAFDVPIASGAFMFARTSVLQAVDGFDPGFFLYFEDFDLSLRLGRRAGIAYVPAVHVVHLGGNAARKGWRHIRLFAGSAFRFFGKHGWLAGGRDEPRQGNERHGSSG